MNITLSHDEKAQSFEVQTFTWTHNAARKKAIKLLFIIWFFGLFTIFIPIVHFVSIPACLIAGPIVSYFVYKAYKDTTEIRKQNAQCPVCQKNFALEVMDLKPNITTTCPACNTELKLSYNS